MAKRQRINVVKNGEIINDPLAYESNFASEKARKSCEENENIRIEIWHDKHYNNRDQFGDDDGAREGIGRQEVEILVCKSIKHLILYSNKLNNFRFLNNKDDISLTIERILCKDVSDISILNVVIEVHYKEIGLYEATIKTAMVADEFRPRDNQYILEIINEDNSILKKNHKNKIIEIYKI